MILVKAKLLRTRTVDKEFEGKKSRHYVFECQKTDLDSSIVPALFSTKSLEASKVLETYLSDKEFHLIPINNARVNAFSMNGTTSFVLDENLILHPDFSNLDDVMVSH